MQIPFRYFDVAFVWKRFIEYLTEAPDREAHHHFFSLGFIGRMCWFGDFRRRTLWKSGTTFPIFFSLVFCSVAVWALLLQQEKLRSETEAKPLTLHWQPHSCCNSNHPQPQFKSFETFICSHNYAQCLCLNLVLIFRWMQSSIGQSWAWYESTLTESK